MTDSQTEIIQSYSANAKEMAAKYASYNRDAMFPFLNDVLTPDVKKILDIGAGSGIDAHRFAATGRRVTAIEPSDLIDIAQVQNNHPNIIWLRDALPELTALKGHEHGFDLVFLNRVFMHVHPNDHARALTRLFDFLAPSGVLYMVTRHGPSLDGRIMYPVDLDAVAATATRAGLIYQLHTMHPDWDGRPEITWSVTTISHTH